jgi:hypothetical protein
MSQEAIEAPSDKPLNPRQKAFARELGIAVAEGKRDFTEPYAKAGFSPHRGNAARLAADPRIKTVVDEVCAEQLRLAGLHVGYLQAKTLQMFHASSTAIHRKIGQFIELIEDAKGNPIFARFRQDLTAEEAAELDAITWPLSEFKIDKDGIVTIKLSDKKAIAEMLLKQMGVGKDDPTNVNVGVQNAVRFIVEGGPVATLSQAV